MEARDDSLSTHLQKLSPARRELLLRRLRGQEAPAEGVGESHPPLVRVPRKGDLLPSFAQRQYWLLSRLAPESSFYNVPGTIRMAGALSVPALEMAFREILRRHELLRTSLHEVDGQPRQRIHPTLDWRLPVLDLESLPPQERETRASELATLETSRPFDLTVAPILRVLLLRLSPEDHVLVLASHHALFEAWSWGVLLRELSQLYGSFLAGEPSPLPELAVQYADYAAWQHRDLGGERLSSLVGFWRRALEGFAPLVLPTDRPRPKSRSFRGAVCQTLVPRAECTAMTALATAERATPFVVFLAAFLTVLQKHSGQDDVVVGTPVANRPIPELEPLIGPFLNTVVVRGDLSGNPMFRELVRRTREVALDAHSHQALPFETLVEELKPERLPNQNPIYQVMFNFQNAPAPAVTFPGLSLSGLDFDTRGVRLDLSFIVQERPEGLEATVVYSVDLFEAPTVARLLAHFRAVVTAAALHPEAPLSEISPLGDAERHQVLLEWAWSEASPSPTDVWLPDLMARQAAATPDAVAYAFEEQALTYAELCARSADLARALYRLGAGPEVRVGLLLERSLAAAVGVWGTLFSGATFVPLDPSAPRQRLDGLIEDAGVRILLCRRDQPLDPPTAGIPILNLDDGGRIVDGDTPAPRAVALPAACPGNAAYVLYTSGSTGRPKGVVVEHRHVAAHLQAIVRRTGLTPGMRCALLQGLIVDASMLILLLPALQETCVHLISEDRALDPDGYADYARRHRIELLKIAPSHLNALLGGEGCSAIAALTCLIVGGEAFRPALLRRVREQDPDCRVWNFYGPTETTVGVVVQPLDRGHEEARSLPIGRPLAAVHACVLDAAGQAVPIGVPGELCIGGALVTRGYLGRPGETAARFVPDPRPGTAAGARLYRTGDRVRWLPAGVLDFLGRIDAQVKIRGFRVELGEIEVALLRHPAVREAVVARLGDAGEESLAAWIAPSGVTASELRSFLRERLPEYMVPGAYTVLESLPRTSHGKLDRRALPAPTPPDAAVEASPPRTAAEQEVAAIWEAVLNRAPAGIDDNFFDLGGHSLLAFMVVGHVRKRLQVNLPPSAVFEMPTVRELALEITRRQLAAADPKTLQKALSNLQGRLDGGVGGGVR